MVHIKGCQCYVWYPFAHLAAQTSYVTQHPLRCSFEVHMGVGTHKNGYNQGFSTAFILNKMQLFYSGDEITLFSCISMVKMCDFLCNVQFTS